MMSVPKLRIEHRCSKLRFWFNLGYSGGGNRCFTSLRELTPFVLQELRNHLRSHLVVLDWNKHIPTTGHHLPHDNFKSLTLDGLECENGSSKEWSDKYKFNATICIYHSDGSPTEMQQYVKTIFEQTILRTSFLPEFESIPFFITGPFESVISM